MSVRIVHQKIKDESIEEAEAAVRELFATLEHLRPVGLRYASTRVVDSSTFVILTELAEGVAEGSRRSAAGDPRVSPVPRAARGLGRRTASDRRR